MYQRPDRRPDAPMREDITLSSNGSRLSPHALRQLRRQKHESQEVFWARFGVTQSSGSRFEIGDPIPATLEIMMLLYLDGELTDELLAGYLPCVAHLSNARLLNSIVTRG